MERLDELLARAERSIPGPEANAALWNLRQTLEVDFANVVIYELVLRNDQTWAELLEIQIPRMTEHFAAKGLGLFGGPSAIVSLWRGERIHLFAAPEFFAAVRDLAGLDEAAMKESVGAARERLGLSRAARGVHAVPATPAMPLALPPSTAERK